MAGAERGTRGGGRSGGREARPRASGGMPSPASHWRTIHGAVFTLMCELSWVWTHLPPPIASAGSHALRCGRICPLPPPLFTAGSRISESGSKPPLQPALSGGGVTDSLPHPQQQQQPQWVTGGSVGGGSGSAQQPPLGGGMKRAMSLPNPFCNSFGLGEGAKRE